MELFHEGWLPIDAEAPIAMVDDNHADLLIAQECAEMSAVPNPWLAFVDVEAFLAYLQRVRRAGAPMPAVVLLDLNMPRRHGFEVLESVRSDRFFESRPPVVILTSSDRREDRCRAAALGADGFARKPMDVAGFVSLLNSLVER